MTDSLFTRSSLNPILGPTARWWEARAAFNPGIALVGGRVAIVYRAVGADGISRFGLAWSEDGERIVERADLPFYEGDLNDPLARLGVEDPRIVLLERRYYLTYCKASVAPASTPPLSWEPAPFRVRSGVGVSDDFASMRELSVILDGENSKDAVLFPERIGGQYAALIRVYPSIQLLTSPDLRTWSAPCPIMEPIAGSWEAERIGAGPPPLPTPWGWLLLYHGNEFLALPDNRRRYAMGMAILDLHDPTRVLYRHPDPVLWPREPYEIEGPVGNVVFGTGLVERRERYYLYYGAGDGVIGVAWAERDAIFELLRSAIGPEPAS